jgi:hypothetical protein
VESKSSFDTYRRARFLASAHFGLNSRNGMVAGFPIFARLEISLVKCGFALDVEPPASFEVVEVASGKRSLIRSSQCQLIGGPIGWMASDIRK